MPISLPPFGPAAVFAPALGQLEAGLAEVDSMAPPEPRPEPPTPNPLAAAAAVGAGILSDAFTGGNGAARAARENFAARREAALAARAENIAAREAFFRNKKLQRIEILSQMADVRAKQAQAMGDAITFEKETQRSLNYLKQQEKLKSDAALALESARHRDDMATLSRKAELFGTDGGGAADTTRAVNPKDVDIALGRYTDDVSRIREKYQMVDVKTGFLGLGGKKGGEEGRRALRTRAAQAILTAQYPEVAAAALADYASVLPLTSDGKIDESTPEFANFNIWMQQVFPGPEERRKQIRQMFGEGGSDSR